MDGGFKKHGHGCLWLLARLLPTSLPISLVKYAFSLIRKTESCTGSALPAKHLGGTAAYENSFLLLFPKSFDIFPVHSILLF